MFIRETYFTLLLSKWLATIANGTPWILRDASEEAHGGVVFLLSRINDTCHVSIVMAKTKVAPLKRQTILRVEHTCLHTYSIMLGKSSEFP